MTTEVTLTIDELMEGINEADEQALEDTLASSNEEMRSRTTYVLKPL